MKRPWVFTGVLPLCHRTALVQVWWAMQGYSSSPGTHEHFCKDGRSASWPYLATNLMLYISSKIIKGYLKARFLPSRRLKCSDCSGKIMQAQKVHSRREKLKPQELS